MARKNSLGIQHLAGERAWAMLAVSSEQQSDTLAHQKTWAQQTADAHGWQLVRVFGEDRKGVGSGKEGPRAIVRAVEAEIRSLEPEARPTRLLVIRLDRIGRGNIAESQMLLHNLNSLGVGVWTSDGEVKLDTSTEQLLNAFHLFGAQHENEIRAAKARWVYARKRTAGQIIGNRRPYGLKLKDGKDVKDGKRGDAVREAFKLRAAGYGYFRISKRLAAIAPPAINKKGAQKVIEWGTSRMASLLSNRAYIGVLVNEATFAKAQRVRKMLSSPEREGDVRRRWPWPLSGAIKCSCGRAMTGVCSGKEGSRIRYYACRSHQNHSGKVRLVRARDIEKEFLELLGQLRASPELLKRYRARAASPVSRSLLERSLRDLRAKSGAVEKARERVFDLYVSGDVRREDVQQKLDAFAAEREELAARIISVQEQIVVANDSSERDRDADALLRQAAKTFEKATEPEQRLIARAVAVELGGLHIDASSRLKVGTVTPSPGRKKLAV